MDKEEEYTKELFFNQMNDFEHNTAKKIIDILNEKKYMLESEVLGLVATARALTLLYAENKDSKDALLDTAIYMLQEGKKRELSHDL